jgi:hypothetical protein
MRSEILLRDLETQEQVDRVIIELRRRNMPYRHIGDAFSVFTGLSFTEGQIRYRARSKLRLPPGNRRGPGFTNGGDR